MAAERAELEAACRKALAEAGDNVSCDFEFNHGDFDEAHMLQAIPGQGFHAVLVSAVLPTWSRLPHCDPTGPPPVRSRAWPWGFPWLDLEQRTRAERDNVNVHALLNFVKRSLANAPQTPFVLVAPEDLGRVRRSFPASLWQLRGLRDAARAHHCYRSAFHQCQFGPEHFSRPTGALSSFRLPSRTAKLGWPQHNYSIDNVYAGPLGKSCRCGRRHHSMLKAGGEYKAPQRSLSHGSVVWMAVNIVQECLLRQGVDSSPLREGLYYRLEPTDWIPEQPDADTDATVEEDLLWPPMDNSDDSGGQREFHRACQRARAPPREEDHSSDSICSEQVASRVF